VKATEVTAGLAESNGSLLPRLWRDSRHITDQLQTQSSVTSMGKLYLLPLPFYVTSGSFIVYTAWLVNVVSQTIIINWDKIIN